MKTPADFIKTHTYREKLSDPRWKAFAADMRARSNNACQSCKQKGLVLQVHHWFYDGREPWEYLPEEVTVLCEGCHKRLHEELKKFRQFVFAKLSPHAFRVLNGSLAVAFDQYEPATFVYALAEMASSPGSVRRFANAWIEKPAAKDLEKV